MEKDSNSSEKNKEKPMPLPGFQFPPAADEVRSQLPKPIQDTTKDNDEEDNESDADSVEDNESDHLDSDEDDELGDEEDNESDADSVEDNESNHLDSDEDDELGDEEDNEHEESPKREKIQVCYMQKGALQFIYDAAAAAYAACGQRTEHTLSDEIRNAGFGIEPDELATIACNHDLSALKINGGVVGMKPMQDRPLAWETMGSSKTGTLTTNHLVVDSMWIGGKAKDINNNHGEEILRLEISEGVLNHLFQVIFENTGCEVSKDEDGNKRILGTTTEKALFEVGLLLGGDCDAQRREFQILKVEPLSSVRKKMSVLVALPEGGMRAYCEGALEIVLNMCDKAVDNNGKLVYFSDEDVRNVKNVVEGLRTLCLAFKDLDINTEETSIPAFGYTLVAIVEIKDPVRPGFNDAITVCKEAGIDVPMVIGDNIETPNAIAMECGILTEDGLATEAPDFHSKSPEEMEEIIPNIQVMASSFPLDKHEENVGLSMGISGTEVDSTTTKQSPGDYVGNEDDMHSKSTAEEALVEKGDGPDDLELEGCKRGKKVRRAGARRTRAKLAVRQQREAVQPTPLLTGLNNHPSIYIRSGQRPPQPDHVSQDTWTQAFEVYSSAAQVYKELLRKAGFGDFLRIQPLRIRSCSSYLRALVERYFSETHTLHLGTFEIGPTPLAWCKIIGIWFGGIPLDPPAITHEACTKLLGFKSTKGIFVKGKLKLDALCPKSLDFRKDPHGNDLDWMFRRLIVYLVGACFFSGTDLTVPINLVSAMSNIQNICQYDWGAATFSAFLRGMRQKTTKCYGAFSGFYPFLLLWAYEHIPYMRPLAILGADVFPLAIRWTLANMEVPNSLNDFLSHRLELEYLEEDQVNFNLCENFWDEKQFKIEIALSQKRIAFRGLESWEVYMGERNLQQFGVGKRIPQAPPEERFGEQFPPPEELMQGINARTLLQNEKCDYGEWFRINSLGRIVALDQFKGKQILGGRLLELWFQVHRDGYKVLSPQDLQTLEDVKTEKQALEAKLKDCLAEGKTLKKDLDHLYAQSDLWQKRALGAEARISALGAHSSQMGPRMR